MTSQAVPSDSAARMTRAQLSVDGLSIGDAFGSQFFVPGVYSKHFAARTTPGGIWGYTDDTEMALGIVEVLDQHGCIDQRHLADVFARRYAADTYRGYGAMAHQILTAIATGTPWRNAAYAAFNGQGSMGNGAAMRVAPLGAYFADDLERLVHEAAASAEVTHAHPEGKAGAVAIAVAAAVAWRRCSLPDHTQTNSRLLADVLEHTPPGKTSDRVAYALDLPAETDPKEAGRILGNGSQVTAPDTVPYCVWCADQFLADFADAMWATLSAGGDIDTTCAIVGGVVALAAPDTIPAAWRAAREPLRH
jgi:ADP-ribosylglycohydrolase